MPQATAYLRKKGYTMATRCQIGFFQTMPSVQTMIKELNKGGTPSAIALIYKHRDGHPDSVLPVLTAFLEKCERNQDPDYCAAWYLHTLISQHIEIMKKIRPDSNGHDYMSHGIDHEYHGDLDYFYAVANGKVQAYRCGCDKWSKA